MALTFLTLTSLSKVVGAKSRSTCVCVPHEGIRFTSIGLQHIGLSVCRKEAPSCSLILSVHFALVRSCVVGLQLGTLSMVLELVVTDLLQRG